MGSSADTCSCSSDVGDSDAGECNWHILYTLLDTNGSGMLDLAELTSAMRHVLHVPAVEVDEMVEFLFQELDKDGSGSIDVAELVCFIEDIGGLYEPAEVYEPMEWARVWRPGCDDDGAADEGGRRPGSGGWCNSGQWCGSSMPQQERRMPRRRRRWRRSARPLNRRMRSTLIRRCGGGCAGRRTASPRLTSAPSTRHRIP